MRNPELVWRDHMRALGFAVPVHPLRVHGSHLVSTTASYHEALFACREFSDAAPENELAWQARSTICQRLGLGDEWRACRERVAEFSVRELGMLSSDQAAVKGFVLAAEGAAPVQPDCAPKAYVRRMFDDYAPTFQTHLVDDLDYRGHIGVADMVSRLKRGDLQVLDLGCGTGLVGAELLRVGGAYCVHGVDIAPKMLERAAEAGTYAALTCSDVYEFLGESRQRYDVVTAADVLIYLGDAQPLTRAVENVLEPDGVFVFTIERADDDTACRLTPNRRYQHGVDYIESCAREAGLVTIAVEPIVIRHEFQGPVDGAVIALARSADAAAGRAGE